MRWPHWPHSPAQIQPRLVIKRRLRWRRRRAAPHFRFTTSHYNSALRPSHPSDGHIRPLKGLLKGPLFTPRFSITSDDYQGQDLPPQVHVHCVHKVGTLESRLCSANSYCRENELALISAREIETFIFTGHLGTRFFESQFTNFDFFSNLRTTVYPRIKAPISVKLW